MMHTISNRHQRTYCKYRKLQRRIASSCAGKKLQEQMHLLRRYERQLIAAGLLGLLSLSPYAASAQADCEAPLADSLVNTTTGGNQINPEVASAANGNYVVVWQGPNIGDDVFFQRFSADGEPLGSQTAVSTITAVRTNPAVAMDDDGNFVIAWQYDYDGEANDIRLQRFDAGGNTVGSSFRVNAHFTGEQMQPAVALENDGDFVVTWWGAGGGDAEGIYAQRFDDAAAPLGAQFRVNTSTSNKQENPDIAMDHDGDFVIVWQSEGLSSPTTGRQIYAQRYDPAGQMKGSEMDVSLNQDTNRMDHPTIAMDQSGQFVIAWYNQGDFFLSDATKIEAQRFDAMGGPLGGNVRVNTHTTDTQTRPDVAMDQDGDFVITWQSMDQDGGDYGIYAQRYDKEGATVGTEFLVNTYTTAAQTLPAVAMDGAGDFVIAWQSDGQDGSGLGIYSKRYNCPYTQPTHCRGAMSDSLVNTSSTIGDQFNPDIAMDSDGDYVVVWQNNSLFDYHIYARLYNAAGEQVGDRFRINQNATPSNADPAVAMDSDGNFVVTWVVLDDPNTGDDIYARRFDFGGFDLGDAFIVNSSTAKQRNPDVAMDADGDFVITWDSYGHDDSFSYGIFARRYDKDGVAFGSDFSVNTHTTGDQVTPAIAMEAEGEFQIVWSGPGPDGQLSEIYGRRYSAAGVAMSTVEERMNFFTIEIQTQPDIAMDDDGDFVVTWLKKFNSSNRIEARRFDQNCVALDDWEFQVNSPGSDPANPRVGMDTDGDFVITWQSFNLEAPGSGWGVFARRYHPRGEPKDVTEFQVNSYSTSGQFTPTIALDPDGDATIVWHSYGQDGSSFGVYSKGYDCCPPAYAETYGTQLEGTILTNTHLEASMLIESIQTLDGGEIHYDAGECVELLGGFEVIGGTVFEAKIGGCDQ